MSNSTEPTLRSLDERDIIKVRTGDEVASAHKSSPEDTRKAFTTINKPGFTKPQGIPDDFVARPAFPVLKPRKLADLPSMTDEYYLLHHGLWFTWGGLQYDPLLEFFVRDGESSKCVSLIPLKDRFLYGVARNQNELSAELGLFAIPRERMRDILFWMDGVVIADNGQLRWQSCRQHLPFDQRLAKTFDDRQSTEYIGFYGFRAVEFSYKWFYYADGFGAAKVNNAPKRPPEKKIIVP